MEENNNPIENTQSLFRVLAWIGVAGNAIVGIVALFFMVSGITGTGFMTNIDDASISTSKVILSILILLLVVVLCSAAVIGLMKLIRGDRKGRKLFLIANLVWIALTFLILRDYGFYQLGIFSAIYTLVVLFLSREEGVKESEG